MTGNYPPFRKGVKTNCGFVGNAQWVLDKRESHNANADAAWAKSIMSDLNKAINSIPETVPGYLTESQHDECHEAHRNLEAAYRALERFLSAQVSTE